MSAVEPKTTTNLRKPERISASWPTYHRTELSDEDNPYKLITRRIDSGRIIYKQRKRINVDVDLIKYMKPVLSGNPIRSGAIIYTKYQGQTYFCLGVDAESNDLTDFGGGVKKHENNIVGGLRELCEESQGLFNLTPDEVTDDIVVYSHNMMIMFIYRDVDMHETVLNFREKIKNKENPEVKNIVWLTTDKILESIHCKGRKMYVRVSKLLSKATATIGSL